MGRRLPSSGDEVLELREALQDALGEVVADGRISQGCALMESDYLQDLSTQSHPRSVAGEPRERDLSASCRGESEETKVESDVRSDGVVYPDLPELAANESTRSQGSRSTECSQTIPYKGPGLAELAADESTRPRPTSILEMPLQPASTYSAQSESRLSELAADEDTQPRLATPRDIRPASALPAPRLPEVATDEHVRELSSVPPRVVPPTRYGLHNYPAHTRSYAYAPGWIDEHDPETALLHREPHPHRYAADSNIGGEAETTASAPLEIPRPTTRRGPGLPEPTADDAVRTLPADVFAPSTPTTRRVCGVPVEAYPIHEPEYPNVVDRETGFTYRESNPRYTEDQELEITAAPAAPDPRRQLLERLCTSDLSYEQRRRSLAPSPAPLPTGEDMSPWTSLRQRSSTTTSPISLHDTRSSTSGIMRRCSSPQTSEMSPSVGIAARGSSGSQFAASAVEQAAFSFGVHSATLRSTERVRDENQSPVSPTSRDPHSRSSITGILATGGGALGGGGPAQYSDLAHLHRTQGPAIAGSTPVERLGSQDIYSDAGVQRDSLRGSAGETMARTGPMMDKDGKDEEEKKSGEKRADEVGTVGQ
ncbi:hypothetical protein LTR12_013435 [Friedmanniomyces endolithicus]|nr:hypothetical protein LTR12_013435 [Friedmanniomyces endolithicus]